MKKRRLIVLLLVVTMMTLVVISPVSAAPIVYVYYQDSAGDMIQADMELASVTGPAMLTPLRQQYTGARSAFRSIFFEIEGGAVFDWTTNGIIGGQSWADVQNGAACAKPVFSKVLNSDGTATAPVTADEFKVIDIY